MKKKQTLHKPICIKCRATHGGLTWGGYDDDKWKVGIIECPVVEDNDETPPKACHYRIEHILTTQEKPE